MTFGPPSLDVSYKVLLMEKAALDVSSNLSRTVSDRKLLRKVVDEEPS